MLEMNTAKKRKRKDFMNNKTSISRQFSALSPISISAPQTRRSERMMDVDSCTNTEWPFRVVKNNCTSSSPSHLHQIKSRPESVNQWDNEMPLHVAGCSDESRSSKMLKLDWCSDASGQNHKLLPDLCSHRPQFSFKKASSLRAAERSRDELHP